MKTEKRKVPELRFKEFTEEWKQVKVGDISDCIVPGRNKPKTFAGTIPWITTPDINRKYIQGDETKLYLSDKEVKSIGAKIVPSNSIIMSCVGELGVVAISKNDLVINQQLHAFLPYSDNSTEFISYYLTTQRRYMDIVATKTSVPYMNKATCNSIPVSLPSKKEQQKIASFLSKVDEKIEKTEKKKELFEQYKKGMMQKIFSQQIRFKDDNGNDYSDWKDKRLGKVSTVVMGQSPSSSAYNEIGIGLHLIQGNADCQNRKTCPRSWTSEITKECNVGDIIMTVRAPVGAISKSIHKACIGRGVCAIKPLLNEEYIYQVLLEKESKWETFSQGSTFTAVNSKDIKNLRINLPSLPEQQKIASFLSSIDKKIEAIDKELQNLKQFKKGLLQKMFV